MTTTTKKATDNIEVKDVGPIEQAMIPLPAGGGVTELVGSNGVGKSTALRSVSAVIEGTGKHGLSARKNGSDLDVKGTIKYGELTVIVRHSVRHKGTAELCHLEGKLDLETFVDPGLVDVDKSDERRIKALVSLTGVETDYETISAAVGGEENFEAIASPATIRAEGLVDMAARLKRDIFAKARDLENTATNAEGKATALAASISGVADDDDVNIETLSQAHYDAIRNDAAIANRILAAIEVESKGKEAQKQLAEIEAKYDGPSAAVAADRSSDLIRKVEKAKEALGGLMAESIEAESIAREAESHEQLVLGCRSLVDEATQSETISESELDASAKKVRDCKAAIDRAEEIIAARKTRKTSEGHRLIATDAREEAVRLRDAAKGLDDVIADAIQHDRLRVLDGRLVVEHPRTKKESYFNDLSDGERWAIAIDIAVETLNKKGVPTDKRILQISQHAWEGLDPENRAIVHRKAIDCGVNIVTAIVSDGPLIARVFVPAV